MGGGIESKFVKKIENTKKKWGGRARPPSRPINLGGNFSQYVRDKQVL